MAISLVSQTETIQSGSNFNATISSLQPGDMIFAVVGTNSTTQFRTSIGPEWRIRASVNNSNRLTKLYSRVSNVTGNLSVTFLEYASFFVLRGSTARIQIGSVAKRIGSDSTIVYPALTLQDPNSTSRVISLAHGIVAQTLQTSPVNSTPLHLQEIGTGTKHASHISTNTATGTWPEASVAVGTASAWNSITIEVYERNELEETRYEFVTDFHSNSAGSPVTNPQNALGETDGVYTSDFNTSNSWICGWGFTGLPPVEGGRLKSLLPPGSEISGPVHFRVRLTKGSNAGNPVLNSVENFVNSRGTDADPLLDAPMTVQTTSLVDLELPFRLDYVQLDNRNYGVTLNVTAAGGSPSNRNSVGVDSVIMVVYARPTTPPSEGTLSTTEQTNDTASISGSVDPNFMRAVESGSDSLAASGTVDVSGSVTARELGKDTSSASGSVAVSGSVTARELGQDAATFTGNSTVAANLSASEQGSDTANGTGSVLVSGSLAPRESGGKDDATAFGTVVVSGSLLATESPDTFSSSGTVDVSGSVAAQELGQDDATFAGTVEPKERHLLQANVQNISTTTSSVSIARLMEADLISNSATNSSLAVNKLLMSSIVSQSETSSDLIKDSGLQTSFESVSSIEANIFKDISIESSAFAETSVSADILNELNLSASFVSNSESESSLAQQINVFLASEALSSSQTTSDVSIAKTIDSSMVSVAMQSADLDKFVALDSDAFAETLFTAEVQKSSLMNSSVESSSFFLSELSVGNVVLLFSDNNASEASIKADLFKQVEFSAETAFVETTTNASLNIQVILDSDFTSESTSLSEVVVSKPINSSLEVSSVSESNLNLIKHFESFAALETSAIAEVNLSIEFESSLYSESQSSASIDLQNRLNSMILSSSESNSFADVTKELNSDAVSISDFNSSLRKEVSLFSNLLTETSATSEVLNRLRLSSSFANIAISQSEITKILFLNSSVNNSSVSSSSMKLNKPLNAEVSSQINFTVPNLVFPIRSVILSNASFNATVTVIVNQVEVLRRAEIDVEYPVEKRLAYFTSR